MTGIVAFRTSLTDENGLSIDSGNRLPVDGVGGGGSLIDSYALNDFADGTPLYLGKTKSDGTWLLQKYNSSTGEMRYANVSNNPLITTSRPFCKYLLEANKFYTRSDIEQMSARLGYSVWDRRGGWWNDNGKISESCRHRWVSNIVKRK